MSRGYIMAVRRPGLELHHLSFAMIAALLWGWKPSLTRLPLRPGNDAAILAKLPCFSERIHHGGDGATLPAHLLSVECFEAHDCSASLALEPFFGSGVPIWSLSLSPEINFV